MNLKTFFRNLVFFSMAFLCLTINYPAQSKDDIPLADISEAILVNGKPALKVLSRKKGGYTEVKLQKRDAEDALVFDVVRLSMKNPVGKLFVTKTKIAFESYEKKETNFLVARDQIRKFSIKKSMDGFPSLELTYGDKDEDATIQVKFDRYQHLIDRAAQKAVHGLLFRAIEDFDKALAEFKELTKSAFPEKQNSN